ncbi:MAG: hypothetical protein ACTSUX_01640 [Promethearchaeota archaeon]
MELYQEWMGINAWVYFIRPEGVASAYNLVLFIKLGTKHCILLDYECECYNTRLIHSISLKRI